jgi:hypothetical protein
MFATERERTDALERYRLEWPDVAEAIQDEFFWIVDDCIEALQRCGFSVTTRRVSDLSWGVLATLDWSKRSTFDRPDQQKQRGPKPPC